MSDIDPKILKTLTALRAAFIAKFGREPGPGDPLVFDPDSNDPQPYPRSNFQERIKAAMIAAGTAPQIVYAYEKTGLLLSKQGAAKVSREQLAAYHEALDEYFALEYWRSQHASKTDAGSA